MGIICDFKIASNDVTFLIFMFKFYLCLYVPPVFGFLQSLQEATEPPGAVVTGSWESVGTGN